VKAGVKHIQNKFGWLIFLTVLTLSACTGKVDGLVSNLSSNQTPSVSNQISTANQMSVVTNQNQSTTNGDLEKLLAEISWQAVEEAKRQGVSALPTLRRFANDKNYRIRQLVMNCVGAIGDDQGADILAAGLKDTNINVQLPAARELSQKAYPSAQTAILDSLKNEPENLVRELLALAAGFLSGEKAIPVLRPLAQGDTVLAQNAKTALAKLGDAVGKKAISAGLAASLPRTRYETLQKLCYINDKSFAVQAVKLLSDKAVGIRIGTVYNPKARRVADQAVDTLVCLLNLKPSFTTSVEKIYTDQELTEIRKLAGSK
jgi:aspartokinase